MSSTASIDLAKLFEALPTLPGEAVQRSTEPQNAGTAWFKSLGQGYPDTTAIRDRLEDAVMITDDLNACAEYENALAAGFFSITRDGVASEGEQHNKHVIHKGWDCAIPDAPGQTVRKYMLEADDKSMVFMGAASLAAIVELLEIATALAVVMSDFGVDPCDLFCRSECPWNYEMICAETSEALLNEVAVNLREHATSELWIVCAHQAGTKMNFYLFTGADGSHALECTFDWEFGTTKAGHTGEPFHAIVFWRQ